MDAIPENELNTFIEEKRQRWARFASALHHERYVAEARLKDAREWLLHVQSDLAVVRRKEWALPMSVEKAELRVKAALDAAWEAQEAVAPQQPDLVDEWGCRFYGRAASLAGDTWCHEKDGRRYALRPLIGAACTA